MRQKDYIVREIFYLVSSIWFYICYVISYNGEDLNKNSYIAVYTLTNEQGSYYKLLMTLYQDNLIMLF